MSVRAGPQSSCVLVDGKPRPPVLWSRANKDLPMPSGDWGVGNTRWTFEADQCDAGHDGSVPLPNGSLQRPEHQTPTGSGAAQRGV